MDEHIVWVEFCYVIQMFLLKVIMWNELRSFILDMQSFGQNKHEQLKRVDFFPSGSNL